MLFPVASVYTLQLSSYCPTDYEVCRLRATPPLLADKCTETNKLPRVFKVRLAQHVLPSPRLTCTVYLTFQYHIDIASE